MARQASNFCSYSYNFKTFRVNRRLKEGLRKALNVCCSMTGLAFFFVNVFDMWTGLRVE